MRGHAKSSAMKKKKKSLSKNAKSHRHFDVDNFHIHLIPLRAQPNSKKNEWKRVKTFMKRGKKITDPICSYCNSETTKAEEKYKNWKQFHAEKRKDDETENSLVVRTLPSHSKFVFSFLKAFSLLCWTREGSSSALLLFHCLRQCLFVLFSHLPLFLSRFLWTQYLWSWFLIHLPLAAPLLSSFCSFNLSSSFPPAFSKRWRRSRFLSIFCLSLSVAFSSVLLLILPPLHPPASYPPLISVAFSSLAPFNSVFDSSRVSLLVRHLPPLPLLVLLTHSFSFTLPSFRFLLRDITSPSSSLTLAPVPFASFSLLPSILSSSSPVSLSSPSSLFVLTQTWFPLHCLPLSPCRHFRDRDNFLFLHARTSAFPFFLLARDSLSVSVSSSSPSFSSSLWSW